MKTQATNLFEKLICHKADPDTSFEAAAKMIKSGALNKQEEWVLTEIINSCLKDFTAFELSRGIKDRLYYIIQRRFSSLRAKGKIDRIQIGTKKDGKPIYKQRNGCCVWRIVGS